MLVGRKGEATLQRKHVTTWIDLPEDCAGGIGKHPEVLLELVESSSCGPYLATFETRREGWETLPTKAVKKRTARRKGKR